MWEDRLLRDNWLSGRVLINSRSRRYGLRGGWLSHVPRDGFSDCGLLSDSRLRGNRWGCRLSRNGLLKGGFRKNVYVCFIHSGPCCFCHFLVCGNWSLPGVVDGSLAETLYHLLVVKMVSIPRVNRVTRHLVECDKNLRTNCTWTYK